MTFIKGICFWYSCLPRCRRSESSYQHVWSYFKLNFQHIRSMFALVLVANLLSTLSRFPVDATCMTTNGVPICCRGRQAACSGFTEDNSENKTSPHSVYEHFSSPLLRKLTQLKPCYCDEHCTVTGDCCSDYRAICRKPIVHCMVSTWGPWGPCDRACGKGIRVRRRTVKQPAMNGGRHCPVLLETAACEGYQCGSRRVGRSRSGMLPFLHRAQNEVAHLLPKHGNVLRMIRRWNMRWDVRRKLYLGRLIMQNRTEQPEPEPYCAVYQVTQQSYGCRLSGLGRRHIGIDRNIDESPGLEFSMDEGSIITYTLRNNIHSVSGRIPGSSPTWDHYPPDIPRLWDHEKYREVANGHVTTTFKEGQAICVACYPGYMREDLGMRCSGTGLINVETRWRALRTKDCHGKFRMISMPRRSCTCSRESASFIFV